MPLPPRATPSPREMVCETQDDGNRQTFSFFAFDHTKNFKGLEEKEPKEIWDEEKNAPRRSSVAFSSTSRIES